MVDSTISEKTQNDTSMRNSMTIKAKSPSMLNTMRSIPQINTDTLTLDLSYVDKSSPMLNGSVRFNFDALPKLSFSNSAVISVMRKLVN